jgi:hypothetical protein
MFRRMACALAFSLLGSGMLLADDAQLVSVRHREGLVHGFLALRALDGATLASGDLIQDASGDRVTSRLVFAFRDGSLHDETAVFSQQRQFRLLSYHLVQKGPAFPRTLDVAIDGGSGKTVVRHSAEGGEKVDNETLERAAGLANGLLPILLKNIDPGTPKTTLAFLAATPKPRLVNLDVTPAGEETFEVAGSPRKATHYVVKVDIKGLMGVMASLFGKVPPDSHVWILQGEAPAFVKSESPLYTGGPLWRIELTGPTWPATPAQRPSS